jgi:hypothetical protein
MGKDEPLYKSITEFIPRSTSREIEKHVQDIQIDIKEVREDILTEFAAQDAWRHKWDLVASKCIQFEDCNTCK